jgi:DMSO/TMAO reductase YedYZ molybdopterin-dependent catalytic subunit
VLFDAVVASMPGRIESVLLAWFRHAAKPLLFAGTTMAILSACVVAGALAEWIGNRGTRPVRFGRHAALWLLPFVALGAALRGVALGGDWYRPASGFLFAQVVFAAGSMLWRFGAVKIPDPMSGGSASVRPVWRRREFLQRGARVAVLAAGALAGVEVVRLIRGRVVPTPSSTPMLRPPLPAEGVFARPELSTLLEREITPVARFYRVSKNAIDPEITPTRWQLSIGGLVGRPLVLRMDDLGRFTRVERYHTLMCISNEIGDGLIGNARWAGLRLTDVLEAARVAPRARFVTFRAADGYVETISMAQAEQTLLVYEMNGAPLEDRHGFPLRALVPGTYGMKNPKWITSIWAVTSEEQGFWSRLGWDSGAPPRVFSRIDVPRVRELPGEEVVLGGIAYAGDRGISRVELTTDGGRTWFEAERRPALSPTTWVLWGATWTPPRGGDYTVMVRAVDGHGVVQSAEVRPPFPSGVSGYHRVVLNVAGAGR